ncbi:MAG: hypothetical protein IPN59_04310 [Holophaga sp.]|nr:hypothetical protein [Holophaga sp.]
MGAHALHLPHVHLNGVHFQRNWVFLLGSLLQGWMVDLALLLIGALLAYLVAPTLAE